MNDTEGTNEGLTPRDLTTIRDELQTKLDYDASSHRGLLLGVSWLAAFAMGFTAAMDTWPLWAQAGLFAVAALVFVRTVRTLRRLKDQAVPA